jgi:putative heme utilization carrier protein HutX
MSGVAAQQPARGDAARRLAAIAAAGAELAAKPDGVLETLAETHGLAIADVLGLLGPDNARPVDGARFEEIWSALTEWGTVLFLVHGRNGVFEIKTALPPGTPGRGWFNIHGDTPLGGHLRADRCTAIWFVDRPFFGRRSCSIWFVDAEGEAMFKVFVARNAARELDPIQVVRFEALRNVLCGEDVSRSA